MPSTDPSSYSPLNVNAKENVTQRTCYRTTIEFPHHWYHPKEYCSQALGTSHFTLLQDKMGRKGNSTCKNRLTITYCIRLAKTGERLVDWGWSWCCRIALSPVIAWLFVHSTKAAQAMFFHVLHYTKSVNRETWQFSFLTWCLRITLLVEGLCISTVMIAISGLPAFL